MDVNDYFWNKQLFMSLKYYFWIYLWLLWTKSEIWGAIFLFIDWNAVSISAVQSSDAFEKTMFLLVVCFFLVPPRRFGSLYDGLKLNNSQLGVLSRSFASLVELVSLD